MCTSLHYQAPACCKYVQVLCKLLADGEDDKKCNAKTKIWYICGVFPHKEKQLALDDRVQTLLRNRKKPRERFYSSSEQSEQDTSSTKR